MTFSHSFVRVECVVISRYIVDFFLSSGFEICASFAIISSNRGVCWSLPDHSDIRERGGRADFILIIDFAGC